MPNPDNMGILGSLTWLFSANIVTRVVGLAGQIILGWLLVPEEFGIYALAVSLSAFITVLRSGGIAQVAVQKGQEFSANSRLYYRYALAFDVGAALLLSCLAIPFLLRLSAVGNILLGIAISLPLGTSASIYKTHLLVAGRFRAIACITLFSSLIWQIGLIGFAAGGLRASSFAIPPLLQAMFENIAYRLAAKSVIGPQLDSQPTRTEYVQLFRSARWIMASTAMLSLATTGDYFAVGMLTDAKVVGIYFFAFQLIAAISTPINSAFETVLPVTFTKLNESLERQMEACLKVIQTILVTAIPLSIIIMMVVPAVMHTIWQGKWDVAISSARILALCMPAWLVTSAVRALFEARGLWRYRFVLLGIYGVGGMSAAALGTLFHNVDFIAVSVTTFYVCFACVLLLLLRVYGVNWRDIARQFAPVIVVNGAALMISKTLSTTINDSPSDNFTQLVELVSYLIISLLLNTMFFKDVWRAIIVAPSKRLMGKTPQENR